MFTSKNKDEVNQPTAAPLSVLKKKKKTIIEPPPPPLQPSPTKPPRPSQNKFPNDSSSSAESPPTTPVPITFASIKSPRTNSVSGSMDTRQGMLPAANTLPRMAHYSVPDKNIYSEPEIPTQAWRTHGTDVYDKISEC